uniref:Ovule protein n=1 Tax=Schistosoma curassoni TaxID=6186 RepID=A0A183KLP2_9TREM
LISLTCKYSELGFSLFFGAFKRQSTAKAVSLPSRTALFLSFIPLRSLIKNVHNQEGIGNFTRHAI